MARILHLAVPLFLMACAGDQGVKAFNAEPEAEITSHADGSEVLEGYTESFRGAVSDPDHAAEDLTATWYLDGEVVCESASPDADGISLCDVLIPSSATEITLEVQDPGNAAGSDQISLTVVPTESPEAEITAPTADGVYYSDQLITFEGVVSDGEDVATDLTATWESSLDGVLKVEAEPNDDGEVTGFGYLSEGEHAVQLNVTDTTGKTGTASVIIDVGPPNSAPTCAITAPETNSADEQGTTVVFEGTAEDVDVASDWLTVSWSSDKDGEIGTSTPNSSGGITFAYADLSVNTHLISMTVTDEVGATCTDDILYSVGTAPEISIEAPVSGDVVDEGDVVTFQATVADGEDTATDLALSWQSNLDGEFSTQGSDSTGTILFTESALSVGTHTITASVTDTDGLYATQIVTLQVNGIPTAPEVELTPDPADTSDDLVVTITTDSTDADGDPITYSYAWSVDGVPSTASTSATLSSADTAKGQTWTVEVTPNDGYSDGPFGSDDLTIDNTVPELADATLSPDPAFEADTLICSPGTASDVDGDTVEYGYAWTVSGSTVSETSASLTGDSFNRGDTVTCTVTPNDGEADGSSVTSNTVTIGNTAPSIDLVEITPDPATASSTLTCSYDGYSDDDGDADASTYEWFIDGVSVGTDSTLEGAFVGGDSVTCTVTPNDGTDTGTALSAIQNISNTAPELADVTLSPDPAYEADTLNCTPGTTTDVDGTTSFTYSYRWTVNGGDPGETSSQLTGDDFSRGDTVLCSVRPNDGSADGDPVDSNTLTIGNTAPVVSSVSIDPDPAVASDVLLGGYTFVDDDGDSDDSTIAWTVNGTDAGSDSTLSGAFVYGDEVTCAVTAHDGTDEGTIDSATVTIDNTPQVGRCDPQPRPGLRGRHLDLYAR